MKLIVAIIQRADEAAFLRALSQRGLSSTKLSSSGGFLREGNSTFMVGVEEEQVEGVKEILRSSCCTRSKQIRPLPHMSELGPYFGAEPIEVSVGGAVVFILDVQEFLKL